MESTHRPSAADANTLVVVSKSDLARSAPGDGGFAVSALTGAGMDAFLQALAARIRKSFDSGRSGPALTRARHREALTETAAALEKSLSAAAPELAAEDLRIALRSLGKITGRVHVEDLLDRIFRDFCIGK